MIPPRNPFYRKALAGPHKPYTRVEVWRDGLPVDELTYRPRNTDLIQGSRVFIGGAIRATLGSRVTRSLTMTVPRYLFPRRSYDLLNPYGTELRIFRGITYGNDTPDEFPVFVGQIYKATPAESTATISANDNAGRVALSGFSAPVSSNVGAGLADEFERIVLGGLPSATFGTHSTFGQLVPALAYDLDRGKALDNLAETGGAFWYALADGRFVLRVVPWTQTSPSSAPIPLRDGEGGTLLHAFPDRDSSGLFNRVTLTSERPDGGEALWATADDTDPDSPINVNGPFGVRAVTLRVTGATNQGQLAAVAQQYISRSRARTDAWTISCVPDASIELGDALDVGYDGDTALQYAAGLTMPLDATSPMAIDGRGATSLLEGVDSL